jgi:hypothetical protein
MREGCSLTWEKASWFPKADPGCLSHPDGRKASVWRGAVEELERQRLIERVGQRDNHHNGFTITEFALTAAGRERAAGIDIGRSVDQILA